MCADAPNLWVLLRDACGTYCTPFPNIFEMKTLHTTICSALKWSQSISGIAPMPLAPIRMRQKKCLECPKQPTRGPATVLHQNCGCGSGCGLWKTSSGPVDTPIGICTRMRPAAWGVPTASERGTESKVAHKWARWLNNPCRLRGPHRFRAGGRITGGPQVGKLATQPLPQGGSPPLQSRGQNEKWPSSGQGGYITPLAMGVPTASERVAESEVAHKCPRWLHNPCRLGGPHRFRAGRRMRGGPQVGKGATEPLPPRVSPPIQSEGQNQTWPTTGQGG